jgi:2'-5' RNA ligase
MNIKSNGTLVLDLIAFAKDGASKGCLMAMFDGSIATEVLAFAQSKLDNNNLAPDGRETEPHVTVLYGFEPEFDAAPLETELSKHNGLNFTLGAVSRFECPEYDVLKIEASSPDSQKLHYHLRTKFADSVAVSHPVYHPHVTLGYVKKGSHKELDGDNYFQGKQVSVNELTYSYPNKTSRKKMTLKS